MKKIINIALSTVLLALCVAAEAQQAAKTPRIAYLAARSSPEPRDEAFRHGLRDLGYIESKNIVIEYRYAKGKIEQLPGFVAEMVRLNVDVIVATGTPAAQRAKEATTIIPIVIAIGDDPVEMGLVASLAHPSGNVTGVTTLATELRGKMLELLKETVPRLTRVAVLWSPVDRRFVLNFRELEVDARSLALRLQSFEVRSPDEFENAFRSATKERAQALIMLRAPVINAHLKRIADLAAKGRLAAIHDDGVFVEAGGLMSYGADFPQSYRRAAYYVDRILKGTKPADLPVERPMKFELAFNLKTAKQIGITIPQSVLFRADKVIK
ncbi:MAG: ABC transporter substrate-binding protein [Candidatus Binatia bacterium]